MADELEHQGVAEAITPETPSGTTPEGAVAPVTPEGTQEPAPYTDDELAALVEKGEDFDRNRLTPAQAAIQKTFEKGYTPKFQEAAALKREAEAILAKAKETPEVYFDDPSVNKYFTEYLGDPRKVTREINAHLQRLKSVPIYLEDGTYNPDYTKAQTDAAWYEGIKDDFTITRQTLVERRQREETLNKEMGADVAVLKTYAQTLGFSTGDFDAKPELRVAVKKMYDVANAPQTVKAKEVKPTPPKLAQQGGGGSPTSKLEDAYFDPNISTEERISIGRRMRGT